MSAGVAFQALRAEVASVVMRRIDRGLWPPADKTVDKA